jgi:mannan endo-1,4-beta-mannosidase
MRLIVIVVAIEFLWNAIGGYATERSTSFVKASGTSFTVDGKPFFVTGINNYYLPYATETEVTTVLDDAVALGANVVRTFLVPVIGSPDDDSTTIWKFRNHRTDSLNVNGNFLLYWDNGTNEMGINEAQNGIPKIDFLITEVKKRQLRLIIAFLDFWDFTGGIQQIVAWYNKEYLSLLKLKGFPFARDDHFFFADPRTRKDYQRWVQYVVNRINPQTGVRYRDDPTIMAWELANEANAKPDQLRLSWTEEMATFVKQKDPNHLVGSGNASIDLKEFDISLPTTDFGTWHGYPKYLQVSVDKLDRLISQYCNGAAKYQKPVLLEEFGFARSNPNQAAAYQEWVNTITGDPNCAGWLVWCLVSRLESGRYPVDEVDQFDVRNDGSEIWQVLKTAIQKGATRDD